MAGLAHSRAVNMAVRQTTVTTGAGTGAVHLGMIHRRDWYPGRSHVAGLANSRGVDVAIRQTAVATGAGTGTVDLRMIDGGDRCPGR